MSAKKRKRFEAYMQKRLKKERRVKLFAALEQSSFESDLMKSSRKLGQTVTNLDYNALLEANKEREAASCFARRTSWTTKLRSEC